MATVLALPTLYEAVVARFAADVTLCEQSFGWKEPSKVSSTNARITWTPGDPNGALGSLASARQPGRNPRPLATLEELCTVEIQAFDPAKATSEVAQYEVARLLFDAWYRALYLAAHGTFRVLSTGWVRPKSGLPHGACIRVVFSVDAMVPDRAYRTAETDTKALIDLALLDESESLTIPEDEQ